MWEGMERFLKAVELIGRCCIEGKEFQHSTENTIQRMQEEINKRLLKSDFDAHMQNFQKELHNKLDFRLADFEKEIQKFGKRSEDRLDEFRKKLEDLELNTLWKIKEYE